MAGLVFKSPIHPQNYAGPGSDGGHSWSDYMSSRSNNTWYQNTTGAAIQIGIGLFTNKHIYIGQATNNYVEVIHTGSDPSEAMNAAIVPDDHYYQTDGRRDWTELR